MIVTATGIHGAMVLDVEPIRDERGLFARTWCRNELLAHGLDVEIAQESLSYNPRCGTIRGLHFQRPPFAETKIVRCTRGAIFDVAIDLRIGSPSYLKWEGVELTAENRRAFYIPMGCAHGFQSLADDTEVFYQITRFHEAQAASGYRYDDPAFAVAWPLPVTVIGERDLAWPPFRQSPFPQSE